MTIIFCINCVIFIVIPQKRVFFTNFCTTCDAKNGLKFFWSKMVEIGSITFSITYFSQFLAVYYGMEYYILEQVKCYGFEHPKKILSLCAYFPIYTKCWPKVNICWSFISMKSLMFKNVSELSPDLIFLLEQKIRYFEVCSFSAFEKSKKVPVALLDERVKNERFLTAPNLIEVKK